jgi:hypothetical protein
MLTRIGATGKIAARRRWPVPVECFTQSRRQQDIEIVSWVRIALAIIVVGVVVSWWLHRSVTILQPWIGTRSLCTFLYSSPERIPHCGVFEVR